MVADTQGRGGIIEKELFCLSFFEEGIFNRLWKENGGGGE